MNVTSLSQDPTPEYRTVSYRWGDATDRHEIFVNGHRVGVPRGTYEALRCISQQSGDDARPLWIDAICINQSDMDERAAQVLLMGEIYSRTAQNLIYLGEADDKTEQAIIHVQEIVRELRQVSGYDGGDRRKEIDAMKAVFGGSMFGEIPVPREMSTRFDAEVLASIYDQPWFERVWVIQEAVLPGRSTCLFGAHQVELKQVLDAAAWMVKYATYNMPRPLFTLARLHAANMIWERCALHYGMEGMAKSSLTSLLARTQYSQCSDDRDRIFGVLSLSHREVQIPMPLRPDYGKTIEEVFRDAMKFCVETEGSRELFGHVRHRSTEDISAAGCPSWVPKLWDRENEKLQANLIRPFRPVRFATSEESIVSEPGSDPDVLLMKGVVLDRLRHVSSVLLEHGQDKIEHAAPTILEIALLLRGNGVQIEDDNLARVLMADSNNRIERTSKADWDGLPALVSFLPTGPPWDDWSKLPSEPNNETQAAANFFQAMQYACGRRRFAIASEGGLGLVPRVCQQDDVLVLLCGGYRPMLLRECGDGSGQYLMLGESYFDGAMYEDHVQTLYSEGKEVVFEIR